VIVYLWVVVAPLWREQCYLRRRDANEADVKQILLALHAYHDQYRRFPPAFVVGPDGKRWHSWRALILPHLDEPEFANAYRYDEPWNGPHNSQLGKTAPSMFRSDWQDLPKGRTSYFAIVGRKTAWPAHQSLHAADFVDGTSNTLLIVEDSKDDVNWLEPRDLLAREFVNSLYGDTDLYDGSGRFVGLADGSVRFLQSSVDRKILFRLLTPDSANSTFRGTDWPEDLAGHAEQLLRSPRDVKELAHTSIVASSREPLNAESTQLWCAAFQLAWDNLKGALGGTVEVKNPPRQVELLNRHSFDSNALSPSSRFIMAGGPSDSARMLKAAQDRFPDVKPLLHDIKGLPAGSLQIYAAIRKQMPFETEFSRFEEPLRFQGTTGHANVTSFGHDRDARDDWLPVFKGQVRILDDRGDDDFIVRLATDGPQKDHIIVAMVPPADSLHATWLSVRERIERPNPRHRRFALEAGDVLQVPVLDFQLGRRFEEVEGVLVENYAGPNQVLIARMHMQLRLDETGADFFAEAELRVGSFGGELYDPERPRRLIVNRPFLIAFTEPDASEPYFIGWIANEEVMELSQPNQD